MPGPSQRPCAAYHLDPMHLDTDIPHATEEIAPVDGGVAPGALRPGEGAVRFSCVAGRSVVTRCANAAPLKWLAPRGAGPAAWAYASSFGGGLVAGDQIRMSIQVDADAVGVLSTQASTKVYHQQNAVGAGQQLDAMIDDDGILLVLPDPLTCFADAIYQQAQRFALAPRGSLLLLDWMTCGRSAAGERWAFSTYDSLNVVSVGGREVIFDRTRLLGESITSRPRFSVAGYGAVANLFLVGPAMRAGAEALAAWVGELSLRDEHGWVAGYSPAEWGGVLRLAGRDTQTLTSLLQDRLQFVHALTGGCPWERKW